MKTIKLGILGSGFLQDFHMQAYKELGNVEVVTVGSYTREHAEKFAMKWGIGHVHWGSDAIDKVCSTKEIDAVSIGIPNDLHARAATLAAENGKHVICEKPLGRTAAEAREMLKAVEKAGVIHCYAENQVFFPLYQYAYEAVSNGALGAPYWVRSREAHGGPHAAHFWDVDRSGGGVALDMGCHCVEVARKVFNNDVPVEVMEWGDLVVHKDKTRGEDNCLIVVRYKHGQIGQAENSWSTRAGLDLRMEIHGKEGALFVDPTRETGIKIFSARGAGYTVEKGEGDKGWLFPCPNEYMVYGYYDELKHFTQCIADGKMPIETFKDGVVVNAILDAGYKSAKEKRWMPVEL
ncbi:MAG: Gfo/Idh/MocA family oxidoreductase [Candidatus Lokiarchaeota archaeon]|nr:Gfo/Idh/MocA family oxidoreductase [Candidatus Lokiarchaeota archaeon]